MSGEAEALLESAMKLDHDERERFARLLNERLDEEYEKEGIRIAEERVAQIERGEVELLDWDEFKRRVDDLRK